MIPAVVAWRIQELAAEHRAAIRRGLRAINAARLELEAARQEAARLDAAGEGR